VVVVGDFNAQPRAVGMPPPYVDAWTAAGNDPDGGFTCGQGAVLDNPESRLDERIDYVFVRGGPRRRLEGDELHHRRAVPDDRAG
jgi:endonuclease/exonuclease/phosphatase family metal-dependent hydrolase